MNNLFAESEPKWSDRSPLNSGFKAPRAPVSASPAGQPIGDSTCTQAVCADGPVGDDAYNNFKANENHPARIWQHEVKRGEKRQKKTER